MCKGTPTTLSVYFSFPFSCLLKGFSFVVLNELICRWADYPDLWRITKYIGDLTRSSDLGEKHKILSRSCHLIAKILISSLIKLLVSSAQKVKFHQSASCSISFPAMKAWINCMIAHQSSKNMFHPSMTIHVVNKNPAYASGFLLLSTWINYSVTDQ